MGGGADHRVGGAAEHRIAGGRGVGSRARRVLAGIGSALLGLVGVSVVAPATAGATPAGVPTASRFDGMATVGALFASATAHDHDCTASVVDSPAGDLLITAAHCVAGRGTGMVFVPGYDEGREPYGAWTVVAAYGSEAWIDDHDPQRDFAFLVVADRTLDGRERSIQSVTGANQLGTYPTARDQVTVPAYDAGVDDRPITCTTGVYFTDTYPAFNCTPYVDGTSGAPWLTRVGRTDVVVGVIGGLHHGGCYPYTSYSPAFGSDIDGVYKEAALAMPPSIFPGAGSDGCTTGL